MIRTIRRRGILLLAPALALTGLLTFTATAAQAATTTVTDWTTLDAAFDAAADGDVIVLGSDIDASGTADYLGVPSGAGVTLDLNGHSLTLAPLTGPGLHVGSTSTLTVDDSVGTGRLEAVGSANPADPWPYFPGIGSDTTDLTAGALTIRGGEIVVRGGAYAAGFGGSRFLGGGALTMTGGSLTAQSGTFASAAGAGYLVSNDSYAGSVTVVGAEDGTGLPTVSGSGSADTEPSPVTYTSPTTGVLVTGHANSAVADQGALVLAFHYRVTFAYADGTTADSTQIVDWGKTPLVPADPVRPGYTFAGWASSVPGVTPADHVTAPVTFTAQWMAAPVDVVFDPANGDATTSQSVAPGQAPVVPADPVRAGYTFAGWASSIPGTTPTDPVTVAVTFTAQWTAVPVIPDTPDTGGTTGGTTVGKTPTGSATLAITGGQVPSLWALIGVPLVLGGIALLVRTRRRAGSATS